MSLLRQADAYSAALYPEEGRHPVDVDALSQPGVRFFVARLDGRTVGCGALVLGSHRHAEIKRMVVDAAARGRGIGRAILQAIEAAAMQEGVRAIRLETGPSNQEALSLYQSCGYQRRGPFDSYPAGPFSVFMEKQIAAP